MVGGGCTQVVDWWHLWNPEHPDRRRIVVDGSNLATEGRTLPSLAQLNEAIETFLEEYRGFTAEDVTVVVDASFGHRIDPSEVRPFEEAIEHGEMVTPPAGAVGRGDGFILRIAEKSGALVLSNDSFQEFHAERPVAVRARSAHRRQAGARGGLGVHAHGRRSAGPAAGR